MMKYYICVDGGGTKTEYLLFDDRGHILSSAKTAGTNSTFLPREESIRSVQTGISACLEKGGFLLSDITGGIHLFIPGFEICLHELVNRLGRSDILLYNDYMNAFSGAFGGSKGIVVLAGTGSFAFGMDSNGITASAGAWGPIFGDYGSGYHIGILSLRKVTELFDAGLPGGSLTSLLLQKVGAEYVTDLRLSMNRPEIGRREIADLCLIVERAAGAGDENALHILDEAAKELAKLAQTVYRHLHDQEMPVTLTGGVSNMGKLIITPMCKYLQAMCPSLSYAQPLFPPAIGGMLYVLGQNGTKKVDGEVCRNASAFIEKERK